jgi:hypothetical protein
MGFSLSWVARLGSSRDETLALLNLAPTGHRGALASRPLQGLALPSGTYLVAAQGCDNVIISDQSLAALSVAREVVACSIEEHVMASRCEYWTGGRRSWRVGHDGQRTMRHLETDGVLPPSFDALRRAAQDQQDAEDAGEAAVDFFFEVPLKLAQGIVGFKHDEPAAEIGPHAFETLALPGSGGSDGTDKKWWQIWR